MHFVLSEAIHDTCRFKELTRIMNHLGLSTNYDQAKKILHWQNMQVIDMPDSHRLPVPP